MADTSVSSAIDLSRLPAPAVVEQLSYEEILAQGVARMVELMPTFDATVESDPAVKLLQIFAYREFLIRQQFNDRARQVMLPFATGTNLDQLGALMDVPRLELDAGDPAHGIDPTDEADADYKYRIQLAPESFSVAGPATAYIFHALSADGTLAGASVTSPEPGQVLVSLLSRTGNGAADDDQIEAVTAALGDEVRPCTDQVIVQSADIVDYTVTAELMLFTGPDPLVVLANAQARLAAWIADSRKMGRDITRAGIIAALMVEGVLNVDLISPAADLAIAETECGNCVGSSVTVAGDGD